MTVHLIKPDKNNNKFIEDVIHITFKSNGIVILTLAYGDEDYTVNTNNLNSISEN